MVILKLLNKKLLDRFGKRIKELRQSLNLSQEALAERADVHRTYVGMIERGEKNITLSNIDKFSKALGVKMSELFDGIDEHNHRKNQ